MSGQEFDTIWRQRNSDPLCFHRLVWFNYKSYVDRELNVSPKLYAWANKVSQPFLLEHSPKSLEMDTERFNWPHIIAYFAKHMDKGLWKAVKGVNKRNAKMPPMTTPNCPIIEEEVGLPNKMTRFSIPDSEAMTGSKCDSPRSDPEEASTSLRNTTFDVDGESNSESDAKQSAFTLSNEVTTNDGAHRISFKWKLVQKEFNDLADNKQRLLSEIHAMLSITFMEADGCFYMWDSAELVHPKRVHELTVSDLDEYLEPQITKVHTKQLIVFAVRFAFNENPISWRNSTHVQSAMKLNNLKIHESNVTPKAGIPVVAGYILLKHSTMTLRHKYTQFLRSRMVDTLPYFDIRLHRKTPTDKSIAHLVAYCGEKQVAELCQGLSKILNGHQTAVFLPKGAVRFLYKITSGMYFFT
ncbi:hypothetical protein MHU86_19698 [Fragilaria crotonensis]|nr:hypothetical protein MHU86_19698 [Fragilaria crotonensis]